MKSPLTWPYISSFQERKVEDDKKARTETVKTVREAYHALLVEANVTPESTWPTVGGANAENCASSHPSLSPAVV